MNPAPSLSTLALRLFAGIGGGLIGMFCALGVFLLASFAQPAVELEAISNSYSLVAILAMVFVGTLSSNLTVTALLSLWEKPKYGRLKATLQQVFFFTLLVFILAIPFYLLSSEANLLEIAGTHFLLTALLCALICEIMSGYRSVLTGLLGVLLAGIFLYGMFSLLTFLAPNFSLLVIFFLPLCWVLLILGVFLVEALHGSFFAAYGTMPLSPEEVESRKSKVESARGEA